MTETLATITGPDMPKIIPDTGTKSPNSEREMKFLEKQNIYKAIHQELGKKDVYETDVHKINNIILGQTNEKLQ